MHGWAEQRAAEHAAADLAVLNHVDAVVTCSRHSRAQLAGLGLDPDRIVVIPNGVPAPDPEERTWIPTAIAERISEWRTWRALVLCCVGEIGHRKNQALLLEALGGVTSDRPICCLFVGGGTDVAALERRAAEAGIADRVMFAGHVQQAAAVSALADWLVLPSRREGLPLAVLEAYARGVPALVSDVPELLELDRDGRASLTFRSDDVADLRRALARASDLQSRATRASGARQLWAACYDEHLMIAAYDAVYSKALAARPVPHALSH
jgi:glycosyltransferase involved in cell wall biosynthesis